MLQILESLFWENPRRAVARWLADEGPMLAAAMAYYMAIALFPLLLVLVAVVGLVLAQTQFGKDAEQEILAAVVQQVSPSVGDQLGRLLSTVRDRAGTSGPVGAVLLLAAVLAMFVQFDHAFDLIWNVPRRQAGGILPAIGHVLFRRLKAFLMLLGVWGLVMAAMIVNLAWSGIDEFAAGVWPYWREVSWWLRQGVCLAINVLAFMLVYKFVPKSHVRWRDAVGGGVFTGIGWEIGRQVLAAFVIGQKYTSAYGVIGSFLAVMLWCYYGAAVLFLGAEYTQTLGAERQADAPPGR
jgi:membrane protein